MIPSLALVLILIAAILFLTRQRHRRRAALPPNATLVAADNLERPCPVLISTRYGLKGKPDAILQTPAGLIPIEHKHARPPASPHFPDIIPSRRLLPLNRRRLSANPALHAHPISRHRL